MPLLSVTVSRAAPAASRRVTFAPGLTPRVWSVATPVIDPLPWPGATADTGAGFSACAGTGFEPAAKAGISAAGAGGFSAGGAAAFITGFGTSPCRVASSGTSWPDATLMYSILKGGKFGAETDRV